MKKVTLLIKDIVDYLGEQVQQIYGDDNNGLIIDNLSDIEHVNETSLDWINPSRLDKQTIAECSKAKVLLVDSSIVYSEKMKLGGKVLVVVLNPKIALAKIGNYFFVDDIEPSIHPTAIIHQDAIIGRNVNIGAYTVIGKCFIGDNTWVDSNVRIDDDTFLGNNCIIKSGVVLGSAGFGFEKDENGNLFRFPQIGKLKIGCYVEIGANTCIDRGALSDTIVDDYTKINNLCHIAHNNKIGKNVIITAHVNISGSNVIEDNVWIAPNSSIRGWVHIGKGATIGMGAVVTKDVPAGEIWVGNPAKKLEK
jgi:UDP-3-O-[3-hydroxymyristoyl] glucosamine N-acyltransferase